MAHKVSQARMLLGGDSSTPRDEIKAFGLLEQEAEALDSDAMWMLGLCYEFGMGTFKNLERAEELYGRAKQQGSTTAAFLIEQIANNGKEGRGCSTWNLNCLSAHVHGSWRIEA